MIAHLLPDFSLLRRCVPFRKLFLARMLSVFALGILNVAVPIQAHALSGSDWAVGVAVALDGAGTFLGLMAGGVLADRLDRRPLILWARAACGIGFLLLALNGMLNHPSLMGLLLVSAWDGFFGGISMTALMAAFPAIVGMENLAAAGALSMLTVRLGAILAPLAGGLLTAVADVSWNYVLAGFATLATLPLLLGLPSLRPDPAEATEDVAGPLLALWKGIGLLFSHRFLCVLFGLAVLQSALGTLRVAFPAFSQATGGGAGAVGLMFAVVPLGAVTGALTGGRIAGWAGRSRRGQAALLLLVIGLAALAAGSGMVARPGLLPLLLLVLALSGLVGSLAGLMQFVLMQTHTPDRMRGRVGALFGLADAAGDVGGALLLGVLLRSGAPATAMPVFASCLVLMLVLPTLCLAAGLRRSRRAGQMAGTA